MKVPHKDAILEVEHLSMKFGGLVAIGDLSFQARRGDITALIGPNGAGKTTVFNCITGFYKPTEGMIKLNRKSGKQYLLERMPDFEIPARAKVARTFQNIRLFSGMTLLENLLVAQHNKLMLASGYTVLGMLGFSRYRKASAESVDLAKFWLEKAELVDRADDPAGDLPYGAQRRLEIARAMCTGPELLCLDEPAAGLNPRESLALNNLLNDIKDTTGTSILLIEHDMSVVMEISDHVVVLEYGRKISDGDPGHVKNDPKVIAAYLGVDDEEVVDVLTEVGDTDVIERLDGEPDRAHGPHDSASMMAGPVSDTVSHSDALGEVVSISHSASKADQADRRGKKVKAATVAASRAAARTEPKADKPATAKPASKSASAGKPKASSAATGPITKPAAAKAPAKAAPARSAAVMAVPAKPAKPATRPATAKPAKAQAAPATAKTIAKASPAKPASPKAKSPARNLSAPRGGTADKLTLIKGIGPVNEKKLNQHGIYHFDQIAAWTKADIVAVEAYLAFDGRIAREDWIGQARKLVRAAPKKAAGTGGAK